MPLELPSLPYATDALAPVISEHNLRMHHEGVHAGYLKRLNTLLEGDDQPKRSLENIMRTGRGEAQACACQAWNHTFFWQCLTPWYHPPGQAIEKALSAQWGSLEGFQKAFMASAMAHFMGGWTWLVYTPQGRLDIHNAVDASSPLLKGVTPLLAIDMWEHAWYVDFGSDRRKYLQKLWDIINWPFVEQCLEDAIATAEGRRNRLHA